MDCFNYLTIYLQRHWIYLYYAPSTCCLAQTFRHPTERLTPHPPISSVTIALWTWHGVIPRLSFCDWLTSLTLISSSSPVVHHVQISFSFFWIVFCMYSPRFICSFMMKEHLAASTSRILWIKQPHTRLHTRFCNFLFSGCGRGSVRV